MLTLGPDNKQSPLEAKTVQLHFRLLRSHLRAGLPIFSHSCHFSMSRNKGRESVNASLRTSSKRCLKSCSASGSVSGNGGPDDRFRPYKKTPINLPPGNNSSAILVTYTGQREGVIEQRNVRS